jgi:hypothetical protein
MAEIDTERLKQLLQTGQLSPIMSSDPTKANVPPQQIPTSANAPSTPSIAPVPNSTADLENRLTKLRTSDSLSDHPTTLGKIGHVLGRIGNIAGDIAIPGIMGNIPGTDLNRSYQIRQIEPQLERAKQQEETAAERKATGERADETQALAVRKQNFEEEQAGKPKPKEENWKELAGFEGPKGEPLEIEQNSGQVRVAGGDVVGIRRAQAKPSAEQDTQRATQLRADVAAGKKLAPEDAAWLKGHTEEKTVAPYATAAAQAPQKGTERSDKSFQYNNGALDKVATPIDQANQRMGRLKDALDQNTPQADALIAPELLSVMAGGAGSGLRMNEAEISRIVGGRSKWESLQAAINQWSLDPKAALSITPEQRQEIRALAKTVQDKLVAKEKIIDESRNGLIDSDDPKEHRRIVAETKKKLDKIDAGEERQKPKGVPDEAIWNEQAGQWQLPPKKNNP